MMENDKTMNKASKFRDEYFIVSFYCEFNYLGPSEKFLESLREDGGEGAVLFLGT